MQNTSFQKRKNTFSFLETRILFFLRTKLIGHRLRIRAYFEFSKKYHPKHRWLGSCVLFDTSLKLYLNSILIGSINKLVFKKLVCVYWRISDQKLVSRHIREKRNSFLPHLYKVNTTRVLGNEEPKTRILPYLKGMAYRDCDGSSSPEVSKQEHT